RCPMASTIAGAPAIEWRASNRLLLPTMDYRSLGRSGLKVSPLCLGTMMFGDRTDAAEAGRIVAAARDAGVNFVDTADVYAKGESERILGKLIASDRARWVLATKVANPM